ncbi:hypothetical protein HK102_001585 [Quaeritorhiza haematococci]|nr:hypothetical protein HK102_001585 [Quaeritorhiza haematococci]
MSVMMQYLQDQILGLKGTIHRIQFASDSEQQRMEIRLNAELAELKREVSSLKAQQSRTDLNLKNCIQQKNYLQARLVQRDRQVLELIRTGKELQHEIFVLSTQSRPTKKSAVSCTKSSIAFPRKHDAANSTDCLPVNPKPTETPSTMTANNGIVPLRQGVKTGITTKSLLPTLRMSTTTTKSHQRAVEIPVLTMSTGSAIEVNKPEPQPSVSTSAATTSLTTTTDSTTTKVTEPPFTASTSIDDYLRATGSPTVLTSSTLLPEDTRTGEQIPPLEVNGPVSQLSDLKDNKITGKRVIETRKTKEENGRAAITTKQPGEQKRNTTKRPDLPILPTSSSRTAAGLLTNRMYRSAYRREYAHVPILSNGPVTAKGANPQQAKDAWCASKSSALKQTKNLKDTKQGPGTQANVRDRRTTTPNPNQANPSALPQEPTVVDENKSKEEKNDLAMNNNDAPKFTEQLKTETNKTKTKEEAPREGRTVRTRVTKKPLAVDLEHTQISPSLAGDQSDTTSGYRTLSKKNLEEPPRNGDVTSVTDESPIAIMHSAIAHTLVRHDGTDATMDLDTKMLTSSKTTEATVDYVVPANSATEPVAKTADSIIPTIVSTTSSSVAQLDVPSSEKTAIAAPDGLMLEHGDVELTKVVNEDMAKPNKGKQRLATGLPKNPEQKKKFHRFIELPSPTALSRRKAAGSINVKTFISAYRRELACSARATKEPATEEGLHPHVQVHPKSAELSAPADETKKDMASNKEQGLGTEKTDKYIKGPKLASQTAARNLNSTTSFVPRQNRAAPHAAKGKNSNKAIAPLRTVINKKPTAAPKPARLELTFEKNKNKAVSNVSPTCSAATDTKPENATASCSSSSNLAARKQNKEGQHHELKPERPPQKVLPTIKKSTRTPAANQKAVKKSAKAGASSLAPHPHGNTVDRTDKKSTTSAATTSSSSSTDSLPADLGPTKVAENLRTQDSRTGSSSSMHSPSTPLGSTKAVCSPTFAVMDEAEPSDAPAALVSCTDTPLAKSTGFGVAPMESLLCTFQVDPEDVQAPVFLPSTTKQVVRYPFTDTPSTSSSTEPLERFAGVASGTNFSGVLGGADEITNTVLPQPPLGPPSSSPDLRDCMNNPPSLEGDESTISAAVLSESSSDTIQADSVDAQAALLLSSMMGTPFSMDSFEFLAEVVTSTYTPAAITGNAEKEAAIIPTAITHISPSYTTNNNSTLAKIHEPSDDHPLPTSTRTSGDGTGLTTEPSGAPARTDEIFSAPAAVKAPTSPLLQEGINYDKDICGGECSPRGRVDESAASFNLPMEQMTSIITPILAPTCNPATSQTSHSSTTETKFEEKEITPPTSPPKDETLVELTMAGPIIKSTTDATPPKAPTAPIDLATPPVTCVLVGNSGSALVPPVSNFGSALVPGLESVDKETFKFDARSFVSAASTPPASGSLFKNISFSFGDDATADCTMLSTAASPAEGMVTFTASTTFSGPPKKNRASDFCFGVGLSFGNGMGLAGEEGADPNAMDRPCSTKGEFLNNARAGSPGGINGKDTEKFNAENTGSGIADLDKDRYQPLHLETASRADDIPASVLANVALEARTTSLRQEEYIDGGKKNAENRKDGASVSLGSADEATPLITPTPPTQNTATCMEVSLKEITPPASPRKNTALSNANSNYLTADINSSGNPVATPTPLADPINVDTPPRTRVNSSEQLVLAGDSVAAVVPPVSNFGSTFYGQPTMTHRAPFNFATPHVVSFVANSSGADVEPPVSAFGSTFSGSSFKFELSSVPAATTPSPFASLSEEISFSWNSTTTDDGNESNMPSVSEELFKFTASTEFVPKVRRNQPNDFCFGTGLSFGDGMGSTKEEPPKLTQCLLFATPKVTS